jgi:hypothetical protein
MLFEGRTQNGFVIKKLSEFLQNVLSDSVIEFRHDGLYMCRMNDSETVSVNMFLDSRNFLVYRLNTPEPIKMRLQNRTLYRTLKDLKKTDGIEICCPESADQLQFRYLPKEGIGICTRITVDTDVQLEEIELPDPELYTCSIPGLDDENDSEELLAGCVTFQSGEFQKTIKSFGNMGNSNKVIVMHANDCVVTVAAGTDRIYDREGFFGTTELEPRLPTVELGHFQFNRLNKLSKLSGMGEIIRIFWSQEYPLMIETSVGSLGWIRVYVQTEEEIEACSDNDSDN